MKKVISLLLAAVLVLTLFTACKKGEKKEAETTQPSHTQTTAPLQAKEGKSLDEIKTAFENAFGGRGYQELTACYIDNSDKYYSAIINYYQEEIFDYAVTKEGVETLADYFNSEQAKKVKIDWDSDYKSSDLLGKYYKSEEKDADAGEALKKINQLTAAYVGNELYKITDFIVLRGAVEGLRDKKCELRAYVIETEKGCFLLAFDKHIFLPGYVEE